MVPYGLSAQCSFDITYDEKDICEKETVTFGIKNEPSNLQSFSWDFDITSNTTDKSPKVIYPNAGKYSVELTITLKDNSSCTVTKTDLITVSRIPDMGTVKASKDEACGTSDKITFTSTSSAAIKWDWTIEGKSYSNKQATHKFEFTGHPFVQLTVENKEGCKNRRIFDSLVHVLPKPAVDFGASRILLCEVPGTLKVQPTYNYKGVSIKSYLWNFSGSTNAFDLNKKPTDKYYNKPGLFDVKLELTSNTGCKFNYDFKRIVEVADYGKVKVHHTPLTAAGCKTLRHVLAVRGVKDTSTIHWEFDKKNIEYVDSSEIDSITVFFKKDGVYTIYCIVDQVPCRKKIPVTINAKDGGIHASFNMPECLCKLPAQIEAKNTSQGSITRYEWDVENKKTFTYQDNSKDLSLTVNSYGAYNVKLTAYDNKGCFDVASKGIFIRRNTIVTDDIKRLACLTDRFFVPIDSLCDFEQGDMTWYFLDKNKNVVGTHKGSYVTMNFPDTGYYSVAISLRTKSGCLDSVFLEDYITVNDCLKAFGATFDPAEDCVGLVSIRVNSKGGDNVKITGSLVLASDTTVSYKINYKYPFITAKVLKPGIYNLKVTVSLKTGLGSKKYYQKAALFVNQLKVEGKVGKISGCFPDKKVKLRVVKTENIMFWGGTDTSVSYQWSRKPEAGTSLSNEFGRNTTLTITKPKQVDIQLLAMSSTGCEATWQAVNKVSQDLEAKFWIRPDVCFGDTFSIQNRSIGKIAKYRWSSSSSGDGFDPANFVSEPELKPGGEGKRTISLTIWDKDDCPSTVHKSIHLVDMNMDFTVLDTTSKCSPAGFDFVITGKNAEKYEWYFGDGDTVKTRQKSISKIYDLRRVFPYQNVFSVTLVGKHSSGCVQTKFRQEIIKLRGPYPRFEIVDNVGCSPHTTTFVNKSSNVDRMYFEFNDNVSAYSGFPDNYEYVVDTANEFEVFNPWMVAYDKYDCRADFRPLDSIVVYSQPVARFGGQPRLGCEPLDVSMKSRSRYAEQYQWEIKQAQFVNIGSKATTTLNAGLYDLKLRVSNAIGCSDELLKEEFYLVNPKPLASFKPQDSVGCVAKDFVVYDRSYSDVPITNYQWYAIGEHYADSSTLREFRPNLNMPGKVDLSLEIINANGCMDTFTLSKGINVYDTLPINPPAFSFISHQSNEAIEVNWLKTEPDYFLKMNLFKIDGDGIPIFNTGNPENVQFVHEHKDLDSMSNCYQLELVDRCRDLYYSKPHCSVHLDVDESVRTATYLRWNHYEGWDSIAAYKVYRAAIGEDYIHLATVPGNQNFYNDSNFCDSTYRYGVTAVSQKRGFHSNSNTLEYSPEYTYQDVPLEVTLASVLDNKHVITHWQPSKQLGNVEYLISRREEGDGKKRVWNTTSDTFIIDKRAKIHDFHYSYRIKVKDQCDNIAGRSNMGRSILLGVEQAGDRVYLRWNPYQHWDQGVDYYILQVKPPGEPYFSTLAELKDTAFLDLDAYLKYELPYTYRVKAVENGPRPDTSYSNERIVIPLPSVFAPNAFSPNGDGVNDSFHIRGWALLEDSVDINEFTLKIFNRWGERVFEAHDLSHGWDGRFKGEMCELDHYVWVAKATALNGTVFFLKGGVTVIR